jgi:hypothetical protein
MKLVDLEGWYHEGATDDIIAVGHIEEQEKV